MILDITARDIEEMTHTLAEGRYYDPSRFSAYDFKEEVPLGGTLLWFERSLERAIARSWFKEKGVTTIDLLDTGEYGADFVLWVDRPLWRVEKGLI